MLTKQFAQLLRVVRDLFEHDAIERRENAQLVPKIFYLFAPGVKVIRRRVLHGLRQSGLATAIRGGDRAANLFPTQMFQVPARNAFLDCLEASDDLSFPTGGGGGE